jgi:hypothetical protein
MGTVQRRERIATALLAGLCANSHVAREYGVPGDEKDAQHAIKLADFLIAELDK